MYTSNLDFLLILLIQLNTVDTEFILAFLFSMFLTPLSDSETSAVCTYLLILSFLVCALSSEPLPTWGKTPANYSSVIVYSSFIFSLSLYNSNTVLQNFLSYFPPG